MKRCGSWILRLVVLVLASSCGSGGNPGPAAPTILFEEDFSAYTAGDPLSSDWADLTGASVDASVMIDGTEKALRLAYDSGAALYNGAGSSTWDDVQIDFNFKASSALADIRFFFRAVPADTNSETYYRLRIRGVDSADNEYYLEQDMSILSAVVTELASGTSSDLEFLSDTYYAIRISVSGSTVKAYFDGADTPFLEHTITGTVLPNGTFGFLLDAADSPVLHVDDIIVTEL